MTMNDFEEDALPNGHWCAQNFLSAISGGLVASVGLVWSLKS